jgi:MFS family permease
MTVRAIAVPAMLLPLVAAWVIQHFGPRVVVCSGLAIGALGVFGAAVAMGGTVWLLVAASVVFVAGISITVPSLITLVGSLAPDKRGMAISLYAFALFVGGSVGPQLPPLASGLGFIGVCLVLGGVLAVASAVNIWD